MKRSRQAIAVEQARLVSNYDLAKEFLLRYPGVLHVGVGIKEKLGRLTDELCFRVYVDRKLPESSLRVRDRLPRKLFGAKVDVLEKGHFFLTAVPDSAKYNSLRGGVQIRNEFLSGNDLNGVGTIGCLARTNDAANKLVGLSASHVLLDGLAGNPTPSGVGTEIGHPTWIKCCCCCSYDEIGDVLLSSAAGGLDCGIVELDSDASSKVAIDATENLIEEIGTILGVAQAVCYEVVRKRGAATRLTSGVVVDVLYEGTKILINPCTEYPNFCEPGDSGAVIVNSANKVVGLLIGASRTEANKGVANHIQPVLSTLNIKIAGQGASTPGLTASPTACLPGGSTTCTGGVTVPSISIAACRAYFLALDSGTLLVGAIVRQGGPGAVTPAEYTRYQAMVTVRALLEPLVFFTSTSWEGMASSNAVPATPVIGTPAQIAAVQNLSTFQIGLIQTHFPGTGPGMIDYGMFQIAFERFMNGELREIPLGPHPWGAGAEVYDGPREPNGSYEMMFSGFAWLCIENSIDAAIWTPLYKIMVQCQEIFMFVYRRHPQGAPPAGRMTVPSLSGTLHSLNPIQLAEPGNPPTVLPYNRSINVNDVGTVLGVDCNISFGAQGYSFDHFNVDAPATNNTTVLRKNRLSATTSIGQSSPTRIAILRADYAPMSYAQVKIAMKENIQRMLYMGNPPF